jgi:formylglycine-generating enzyme
MSDTPMPELVTIPAGPFLMGSADGDEHERPPRVVTLDAFLLGACPVTQAEYARFVAATSRRPPGIWELPAIVRPAQEGRFRELARPYIWADGTPPPGKADRPGVLVTHDDARDYCRWLAQETGRPLRLPTEAEWEKAARGGLEAKRYPWGDSIDPSQAVFLPHLSMKPTLGTAPVRSFAQNGWGLYDCAGNVWEWVSDWYRSDYYGVGDARNPAGPMTGTLRVLRGGGWSNDDVAYLRCACRHPVPPDTYAYSIGFRVASST